MAKDTTASRGALTLTPPSPRQLFMPPFPLPPAIPPNFNVLITFRVDSAGGHNPARLSMSPIPHAGYTAKVRDTAARITFVPAVMDGCAVSASYTITMVLNTSPGRR
jgi:hypothetical protein